MNRKILNQKFEELKIDVLVSTSEQTRIWYTNFFASDGYLFIEKTKATLFADGRYIESAHKKAKNVDVKLLTKGTIEDFVKKQD
jgi:Xaa-Pro aminopeptidase